MSMKPKAQVTQNDPWANMPDWAMDFYRSQTEDATARNERAGDLAEFYSNPANLISPYAGQEATDYVMDAAYDARTGAVNSFENATAGMVDAQERARPTMTAARTGMLDSDARIGNISAPARIPGIIDRANEGYDEAADGVRNTNTEFGQAFDTTGAQDTLNNMDIAGRQGRYESEYVDAMVNPVMSRMQEDTARRLAQMEGSAAAIGGAGNTRLAVEAARVFDEGQRSRAQQEAEMRYQAQRTAQELGMQEADMVADFAQTAANLGLSESELNAQISRMEAETGMSRDQLLASIAEQQANTGMQGAEVETGLGLSIEQARQQALEGAAGIADTEFQQGAAVADVDLAAGQGVLQAGQMGMDAGAFAAEQAELERGITQEGMQAPLTMESWLAQMQSTPLAASLPSSGTQTSSGGGPSTGSQILGAGTSLLGAAMMAGIGPFSDERIKEDVEPITGALEIIRRQRPSSYRYTEPGYDRVPVEGRRSAGLMAQDLEDIPGAVVQDDNGIRRVDAYPVMATIAAALQELDRKVESMSHG